MININPDPYPDQVILCYIILKCILNLQINPKNKLLSNDDILTINVIRYMQN